LVSEDFLKALKGFEDYISSREVSEETCALPMPIKDYDEKEGTKILNWYIKKYRIKVIEWSKSSCGYAYFDRDKQGFHRMKVPKPTNSDRFGVCMHEIKHILDGDIGMRYLQEFRCDKFALDKLNEMNLDTTQWEKRMKWHVLSRVAMATNRGHKDVLEEVQNFYPNVDFTKWYGNKTYVYIDSPKGIGAKNPKFWDYLVIEINGIKQKQ
tara:strand:- start:1414 stop:2043 length:630 start_codon:yes stop_codon:yes gene_type:complete